MDLLLLTLPSPSCGTKIMTGRHLEDSECTDKCTACYYLSLPELTRSTNALPEAGILAGRQKSPLEDMKATSTPLGKCQLFS